MGKAEEIMRVDMQKEYAKQCAAGNHRIGQKAISHDGHTHPSGPQVCLQCDLTLAEIVAQAQSDHTVAVLTELMFGSEADNPQRAPLFTSDELYIRYQQAIDREKGKTGK